MTWARDPKLPELVSLAEAGEILGISRQAVHKRATRGQLLGAQAGDVWVFRRALVEQVAEQERRMSATEIADDIAERVHRGEYQPGTLLPTYRDLAVLYSVGRTTISTVVVLLKERGLVDGSPGRGVFVRDDA